MNAANQFFAKDHDIRVLLFGKESVVSCLDYISWGNFNSIHRWVMDFILLQNDIVIIAYHSDLELSAISESIM